MIEIGQKQSLAYVLYPYDWITKKCILCVNWPKNYYTAREQQQF